MELKDISVLIGMIAVFISTYYFDRWKKRADEKKGKEKLPSILNKNASIRGEINEHLIRIQAYLECSRVSLFEYSNGNYTHSGISLQYIECTYEATDDITRPARTYFKKEPIGPYVKMINKIAESTGVIRFVDNDEDKEISKIQKEWRTSTSYCFRITDIVWDGVISASWVGANKDVCLTLEEIESVQRMVRKINRLMALLVKK